MTNGWLRDLPDTRDLFHCTILNQQKTRNVINKSKKLIIQFSKMKRGVLVKHQTERLVESIGTKAGSQHMQHTDQVKVIED